MSPQLLHALKQAGIMIILAILGVVGEQQFHILSLVPVDPAFAPFIATVAGAAVGSLVRFFEGLRDAGRAEAGIVQPSDVAYDYAQEKAVSTDPTARFVGPHDVKVDAEAVAADNRQMIAFDYD